MEQVPMNQVGILKGYAFKYNYSLQYQCFKTTISSMVSAHTIPYTVE